MLIALSADSVTHVNLVEKDTALFQVNGGPYLTILIVVRRDSFPLMTRVTAQGL